MKYCPSCQCEYPNEDTFCAKCGKPLEKKSSIRFKIGEWIMLLCLLGSIPFLLLPLSRLSQTRDAMETSRTNKWLKEYYEDFVEEASRPTRWDLSVTNSEMEAGSRNYGHIVGTVRNISDKTVKSFKIVVKLKDRSGTVIGTDYDYFYGTLGPWEETDFDIMYEKPSRTVTDYVLEIEEVS